MLTEVSELCFEEYISSEFQSVLYIWSVSWFRTFLYNNEDFFVILSQGLISEDFWEYAVSLSKS